MMVRQRIIVALCFGLLIGLIALQSAVVGAASGYAEHGPPMGTLVRMQRLAQAVDAYHADRGMLPVDLVALHDWEHTRAEQGKVKVFSGFVDGAVRDGWEHPLIYTPAEGGFTLTSLGADGAVGGVGIDADIVRTSPDFSDRHPQPHLTIGQFVTSKRGWFMVKVCGFCGVAAGLLCFTVLRRRLSNLVLPGLLTLLATVLVTYVMGILDIVKYH